MDNAALKCFAFGAKYKTPALDYDNVFTPIYTGSEDDRYLASREYVKSKIKYPSNFELDESTIYTIYTIFAPVINTAKSISFSINGITDTDKFGIMYTDGSYSKNVGDAGYACCKLTDIDYNNGNLDPFSNRKYLCETFSGRIKEGTNNIGELTAIKVALENLSEKSFQVIISDSIYGIKTYREYIHVWKNNGYKAYNKKPIKNKDLITETYDKLKEAQKNKKIVVFAWTKGHANNTFNEICDELAKKEIGL